MGDTSIEWTHRPGYRGRTWNPTRGCSRISPGCEHCYAEGIAERFCGPGLPFEGFANPRAAGGGWTRKVSLIGDKVGDPLSWREPSCVFTNSMSDLFHEALTNEQIAAVFGVMAATPRHRYIVLTKRAQRMRYVVSALDVEMIRDALLRLGGPMIRGDWTLPLENLDLGVSVESQRYADERIPHLLETPAARRIVSYEPALGPVRFRQEWLIGCFDHCPDENRPTVPGDNDPCMGCAAIPGPECGVVRGPKIDQIIVGGESGPSARPFDLAWARSVIAQCRAAGTRAFFKQAGSKPVLDGQPLRLHDRKGGDLLELPEDLRVREFPDVR